MKQLLLSLLIIICLAGCTMLDNEGTKDIEANAEVHFTQEPYFPTDQWLISTPEAQGMDSSQLFTIFEELDERHPGIHSALIVRNHYIVAEAYYDDYNPEIKQWIYSATKSFTSALVGIAIDQGYLRLDEKVVDIFADREIQNVDENKQNLTVEDLVTMRSGYDVDYRMVYSQMLQAEDPVQFMLDLPMKEAPNSSYLYNSGNSHLLSAIIQEKTGMSTVEFAETYLFQPLSITNTQFSELHGVAMGGNGLALTPRDMAKMGLLYLNEGTWDSEPIISKEWIERSTTTDIEEPFIGGSQYGYSWYIDEVEERKVFYAQGAYGQAIYVIPEEELVVVFTSGHDAPEINRRLTPLIGPIIQAVVSEDAIEENEEPFNALSELINRKNEASENMEQSLPDTAAKIDQQKYTFEKNPFHWKEMFLTFDEDGAAQMMLSYEDGITDTFHIGLNGIPLVSDTTLGVHSVTGVWEDEETFVLNIKQLEYLYESTLVIHYTGEKFETIQVRQVNNMPVPSTDEDTGAASEVSFIGKKQN
ncbi:serine hydrolase domain-containing protein [Alkalihalobacterium chitinilyticum]|uniref:Beta-lactamase family protein n=1 Tax=Alkalihalobacterium chitinilyticum TaxID=2980103 RepID=A0ABT5VCX9_9BACI|nr:serine hydrolase [Alkalihalobacterium chitinilyticum]MDE5413301.1 beta-lactamase family protein [Alkalihalobacterium chitinilyticum]